MIEYLIYFIVYGVIGWFIDTMFRSAKERKYTERSYFGIPFMPVYAVGGMTILLFIPVLSPYNIFIKFFTYGVLLSIVEYVGSVFVEITGRERLWDYSDNKFNLHGRTDLTRAVLWGILGLFVEYFIHPFVLRFI